MTTMLMTVENASVHTTTGVLVAPISLSLQAGRPFTILGETGSGKSLLAQAILGLLPAGLTATGRAVIDGVILDLADPTQHRPLWGRHVGVLPQEPWLALDPTMRTLDQIAEGHFYVRGLSHTLAKQAATRDLEDLDLAGAGRKLPGQLSGGMAQRVAFAAARAGGAHIIVADEPTKGLDVTRRDEVIALLMKEVGAGGAVLTITHDLALARQMGGDLAIMLDGKIIESGDAETVLANPAHDYTRKLIAADPENWPKATHAGFVARDIVLKATKLSKSRGGRLLFRDQSLSISQGEIVGVTGPSGSGKSSFGDLLLGLLAPDEGHVERPGSISRARYQKLYQDPPSAFAQKVTIGQALNDLVRLHKLDARKVEPLLVRLRLSRDLLSRLPTEVSGGELQRFALLRALLLDPVFLFADEPTSRLDHITQQETIELIVEIARERNCAVLIVSHDQAMIDKTCDRQIDIRHESAVDVPLYG